MPIDLNNTAELTVSQLVLEIESNAYRFECFCREAVSIIEGGAIILSTSRSWDLGRDGVGTGTARGVYVCVTLRDDVDGKALDDITRLMATTPSIKRVYFCSSKKLSENTLSLLEQQLATELDATFEIKCLGASQLLDTVTGSPGILERHYGGDLKAALKAISPDQSDDGDLNGLHLALIAAAGDTSVKIRQDLYSGALLEVLNDGTPRTAVGCAKKIAERLHLARSISESALKPHLDRLVEDGSLSLQSNLYAITAPGVARWTALQTSAADHILKGRRAIRIAYETSLGENLSDPDFNKIFDILEDYLTAHFHRRGAAIVAEVAGLLDEPEQLELKLESQLSFLEELAQTIANTSQHPQRRQELQQATQDLFHDRTSLATEWLVRVCASYVACCALGLEQSVANALNRLISKTALILDTDVLLSLLGTGEPEHQGVETIVRLWRASGGRIFVGEPVLEEAAYHAHIASLDYEQVRHLVPGTPDDRLRLIENVFVRSFAELLATGTAKRKQWGRYISQFRGATPYDWSTLYSYLQSEYSIQQLPPKVSELDQLEADVRTFMVGLATQAGHSGKAAADKARRDASLYVQIVHFLQGTRATDPGSAALLVSSARRLARAEEKFRRSGEAQIVVPISVALYLVSLAPNVTLGIPAMKAFLFEERRPGFSSDLERSVLRMVRTSTEISMPWAKRGVLMREVRDRIIQDAKRQGLPHATETDARELERKALAESERSRTIQVLGQALDKVVVTTRQEEEVRRLRAEVERLQRELEVAKLPKAKRN